MKYSRVAPLPIVALTLLLSACSGKVEVTSRTRGDDGEDAFTLTMTRASIEAFGQSRVRRFGGDPEDERIGAPASQLRVEVSGSPSALEETYHHLGIVTPANLMQSTFTGGLADDRFVVDRIGRVVNLQRRRGQTPQETVTSGSHHVGAAWLTVVEDNNREVPWQVSAGGNDCIAIGGSDCLDMETITRLMFDEIATSVQAGIESIPLAAVQRHKLHFVPQVVHAGFEADDRRARGFGLIYAVDFSVPGIDWKVLVPISVLFLDNIQGYLVVIDPIDMPGDPGPENLDRVFVKSGGVGTLTESFVRGVVLERLAAVTLPELIPGIAFEEGLLTAINTVAGNPVLTGSPPHVSETYEAILVPDSDEASLAANVVWERDAQGNTSEKQGVRLVFLE